MSIIYKHNYGIKLSKKLFIVRTLSIHFDASPASLSAEKKAENFSTWFSDL